MTRLSRLVQACFCHSSNPSSRTMDMSISSSGQPILDLNKVTVTSSSLFHLALLWVDHWSDCVYLLKTERKTNELKRIRFFEGSNWTSEKQNTVAHSKWRRTLLESQKIEEQTYSCAFISLSKGNLFVFLSIHQLVVVKESF